MLSIGILKNFSYEIIKNIIKNEPSIDAKEINSRPLLHYAVRNKDACKIINLLVEKGADINLYDDNLKTPLCNAIFTECSYEIIDFLIKKGANVNFIGEELIPPLYYAINMQRYDIVKLLIDNGADINAKNYKSMSPLTAALFCNSSYEIIELLINNGADINVDDKEQIRQYFGYIFGVYRIKPDLLINKCIDLNRRTPNFSTALHIALLLKVSYTKIKLLIENGANVNAKDYYFRTPLIYSIGFDCSYEIVKLLIDNGSNINEKFYCNLVQSQDYIDKMISQNIKEKFNEGENTYYLTPLHFAVILERPYEIIKLLIDSGSNVNAQDNYLMTPLHYAIYNNYSFDTVKLLIDNGANVLLKDNEQRTPLYYAIINKSSNQIIELLLSNGIGFVPPTITFTTQSCIYKDVKYESVFYTISRIVLKRNKDSSQIIVPKLHDLIFKPKRCMHYSEEKFYLKYASDEKLLLLYELLHNKHLNKRNYTYDNVILDIIVNHDELVNDILDMYDIDNKPTAKKYPTIHPVITLFIMKQNQNIPKRLSFDQIYFLNHAKFPKGDSFRILKGITISMANIIYPQTESYILNDDKTEKGNNMLHVICKFGHKLSRNIASSEFDIISTFKNINGMTPIFVNNFISQNNVQNDTVDYFGNNYRFYIVP